MEVKRYIIKPSAAYREPGQPHETPTGPAMLYHCRGVDFVEISPAEVEEVVRCKDCIHRGDGVLCPMRHLTWTMGEGYHYIDVTMDEYFCNFGERKEANK